MRIVVTGAAGQLGSELCRQLGPAAVGLDLPEFDLTQADRLHSALEPLRPRALINAAAYTHVDQAEDEPDRCWAVNAEAVGHLARVCHALDCTLVQISTDYVFGGDAQHRTPYRETDVPCPVSVYGRSKLEGERLAAMHPRHVIVRTCGLYGRLGPRSKGHFVQTMLRLAETGKPLRVVCDQWCTPSYVPHVARAIRFLLESGATGLFHVVNQGATTWLEFAAEVFRLRGLNVKVEPIASREYPTRAARPLYSVLDTTKYHSLPGRPEMPLWQTALAEYLSGG